MEIRPQPVLTQLDKHKLHQVHHIQYNSTYLD